MKTLDQKLVILWFAIIATTAFVFVADVKTPLGTAVWVFYFVPIVLSFFLMRPLAPIFIATGITILVIVAFFIKPLGPLGTAAHTITELNRFFCGSTVWALAIIGFQFINTKLEVRSNAWLQSGQTALSQKMVGDPQLNELGGQVLQFLVEYSGAQAGAMFIEEEGEFRRFASYGVPPDARVPEKFGFNDGLLGQTAKEGRIIVLKNVPDGYLAVGSALGEASPRHLLIAPVTIEGKVNGVVELGFFGDMDPRHEQLLSRVSESIAVAIRSAKYRTRLQELLKATQQQSEELQAQSEELRVSNEELQEQTGALKESQVRLEEQQAELEQTNEQLNVQARELEKQKDELGRAKNDVENQARELALASNYKSAFLANMSHELRTPLNSSLILAKLLADNREGNLTPEQVKFAKTIQSAGNDLLALINDVLDLAKVEAGHVEVKPLDVQLSALVESLRGTFQPVAAEKGLALKMRITDGVPEKISTDPQRLEQVIRNLLSNAIKFTEHGEVSLEVSRTPENLVAFAVRDSGIGISPHQQSMIFEPFRQADGGTNRRFGGTGLGLSISREFVRLLGGKIQLKSAIGQGSTFTVVVPVKYERPAVATTHLRPVQTQPVQPMPAPAPPASPVTKAETSNPQPSPSPAPRLNDDRQNLNSSQRRILIVEDDETFARIIYDLAHELGFEALIADTAGEAIKLAAQYSPSGVVLDIGLPDHSGLSVLDRLKADPRTRHIAVHIVSASDQSGAALAMGAAGYMIKPVERDKIADALQKLEVRLTQKLRRVLIVEDNVVQLESLSRLLGTRDVETVGASTAAECLEKLRTNTFDCMVLDLSLPDASGFQLLETLSHEDKYAFPPVIVYTGHELTPDEEQRLRKYSKSIIIKGARSPERLLDEVSLFLHQVVSELPVEHRKMIERARSRDAAL
ncbi:MAG: response regulator, partial [Limisphaerales bacterium]